MKHVILLALALTLSGATSAPLLVYGSFEDPNLGTGNYSYKTPPTGWSGTGALVNAEGSNPFYGRTPPVGQDGKQFYALQARSSIIQNFTPDRSSALTVSWLSGGRPQGGAYGGDQSYVVSITGSGIEQGDLGTFTTTSGQPFTQLTANSMAVRAGEIYTVSFRGLATTDETAFIDGVTVATAVPAPAPSR